MEIKKYIEINLNIFDLNYQRYLCNCFAKQIGLADHQIYFS